MYSFQGESLEKSWIIRHSGHNNSQTTKALSTLLTNIQFANSTCIWIDNGGATNACGSQTANWIVNACLKYCIWHKSKLYAHSLHVVNLVKRGFCFHKGDLKPLCFQGVKLSKHLCNTIRCYQPQVLSAHLSRLWSTVSRDEGSSLISTETYCQLNSLARRWLALGLLSQVNFLNASTSLFM